MSLQDTFPSVHLIVGLSQHGVHQTLEGSALVDIVRVGAHGVCMVVGVVLGMAMVGALLVILFMD